MRLIDADLLTEEIKSLRCTLIGLRAGKGMLTRAADEYRKSILQIIEDQPTAFDKEKVIEELVESRQGEYNDSDDELETLDGEEIYDEGRSQGRFEAYHRASEIVEKGGIE